MSETPARRYLVEGVVQGVGFRWSTMQRARELGISGWVRNLPDGRVEAAATGSAEELASFEEFLHQGPRFARVTGVTVLPLEGDEAATLTGEFQVTR